MSERKRQKCTHVFLDNIVEDSSLLEQVRQFLGVRPDIFTWKKVETYVRVYFLSDLKLHM